MHDFKKRVRLLAEKEGWELEHLPQDGLRVSHGEVAIEFRPISRTGMECICKSSSKEEFNFTADKTLIFDILLRFVRPHLQATLRHYKSTGSLTIADYINEERGEEKIQELKRHIAANPELPFTCGGNRIELEYYRGIVIIADDLMAMAANVVEM